MMLCCHSPAEAPNALAAWMISMFYFPVFALQITRFASASDIPARFIEKNISIRGRLRNITENGLEVEHLPIYVPLLSRLHTKRKDTHTYDPLTHFN